MKAATRPAQQQQQHQAISIHAAREGGDSVPVNSTGIFSISIHAAREGGDLDATALRALVAISIHAAREGGDLLAVYARKVKPISIHAAREGGDWRMRREDRISGGFQSTPPVKAATTYFSRCR